MEGKRRLEWSVFVTTLAIVLLLAPPSFYLCGYFWLATVEEGHWMPEGTPVVHRTYNLKWLAQIYEPAGRIEEHVTNREVDIHYEP
jgi:hypothetical protein